MTLQEIEQFILVTIGHTRYSSLSVSSTPDDMEDFSFLHQCVNIARDEIRLGTNIPQIFKRTANIATVANQCRYTIPETDFDIPISVWLLDASRESVKRLIRVNPSNILSKTGVIPSSQVFGSPNYYQLFGSTSAGLSYIELLATPESAGNLLSIDYKPILSNVSSATDEDILMKKYPMTVLRIAAAYAFQFIKKDLVNFDKWLLLGRSDFKMINLREGSYDPDTTMETEELLSMRRKDRLTI